MRPPSHRRPEPEPASARSRWLRLPLAGALVVLAICAAYASTLDAPFVLDDIPNIVENPTIRVFSAWRHTLSPPIESSVGGRPVLNFSFALNYAMGGVAVRGYHRGNILIHALAALTLLGLVRRTLQSDPLRARFGAAALPLATAAALLWALHPLHTGAVTYVSQRAESLMGLWYFLVLYCTVRSAAPGASRLWPFAAVAACLLGVGTKEIIVTAPLLVLLYDRTFLAGSWRGAWQRRRALYVGLVAACSLLVWLMRGIEARGIAAAGTTPWQYALVECRVVVRYLALIVWPHPLVFDYGQFEPAPGASLAGALLLAPLVAATGYALVRRPVLGFIGAWFFVGLAPTSTFVPVTFQPMGEHRLYVPLAALAAAAAAGLYVLLPRRASVPLLTAAAVGLALTARRNLDYRDPIQLWAGTVELRPDNYRAQNEYALSLALAGRTADAMASIRRALVRRPEASSLQRNLALLLMQAGRTEEALPHFRQVVELEPTFVKGRQEYARALAAAHRLPEAMDQVRAGLQLLPSAPGPHLELGALLTQAERPAEALTEFETAVRLAPDDAHARNELGRALQILGRDREAAVHFDAGLRLEPANPTLLYNHGRALIATGRPADALPPFTRLAALQPDSAAAHFALANTFAALGRLPEAIAEYERTLRLDPTLPQAREFYAMARAQLAR